MLPTGVTQTSPGAAEVIHAAEWVLQITSKAAQISTPTHQHLGPSSAVPDTKVAQMTNAKVSKAKVFYLPPLSFS